MNFTITCGLENSCVWVEKKCDGCKRYWEQHNPNIKYLEDMYEEI